MNDIERRESEELRQDSCLQRGMIGRETFTEDVGGCGKNCEQRRLWSLSLEELLLKPVSAEWSLPGAGQAVRPHKTAPKAAAPFELCEPV